MIFFQKITNLGIVPSTDSQDQHYIRTTNMINLLFIFAIAIPLIMVTTILTNDGIKSYSRYALLIVFGVISLLLNHFKRYRLSKITTSVTPVFTLIVFPVFITHFMHAGMFLWVPYACMVLGIIPFLIFPFEKEKTLMISIILFHMIFIFIFDEILLNIFHDLPDLDFIKKYYLYYVFSKIAITCFLYTSFLFFKSIHHTSQMDLLLLSAELDKQNQTLSTLNNTLEKKVSERTKKLTLQNERIKQLAYTNAHEIRASIARITGLINISKHDIPENEREYCETKITENVYDLEKITQRLSKELIEEN